MLQALVCLKKWSSAPGYVTHLVYDGRQVFSGLFFFSLLIREAASEHPLLFSETAGDWLPWSFSEFL